MCVGSIGGITPKEHGMIDYAEHRGVAEEKFVALCSFLYVTEGTEKLGSERDDAKPPAD